MIRPLLPIGLAAAAAVIAVPAAVQAAAPTVNRLALTVTTAEGVTSTVTLRCRPTGGTHPSAAQACAALARVRGDLAKLPTRSGMCTMQFEPVTAKAAGRWAGRRVTFDRTFGNACQLTLQTSGVFVVPNGG